MRRLRALFDSLNQLRRDASGATLVESAVVLPVLVLILLGIGKFGVSFNHTLILTDAVRIATRQLALSRGQTNPCQIAATRLIGSAVGLTSGSISITTTVNSTAYAYPTTCSSATLTSGNDATISATYPCDLVIMGVNFASGCTLRATTTERIE